MWWAQAHVRHQSILPQGTSRASGDRFGELGVAQEPFESKVLILMAQLADCKVVVGRKDMIAVVVVGRAGKDL